ncbi:unnamed protein product, partial [Laminaria digitata]
VGAPVAGIRTLRARSGLVTLVSVIEVRFVERGPAHEPEHELLVIKWVSCFLSPIRSSLFLFFVFVFSFLFFFRAVFVLCCCCFYRVLPAFFLCRNKLNVDKPPPSLP